jgi:hypothetical protein
MKGQGKSTKDPLEKALASRGIVVGESVDVRTLRQAADQLKVEGILFFEEDLSKVEDFGAVMDRFRNVPEYERPFIRVQSFLQFATESDPAFQQRLREFPLKITIVGFGEYIDGGLTVPCVKGLMPFLGEIDFNADTLLG